MDSRNAAHCDERETHSSSFSVVILVSDIYAVADATDIDLPTADSSLEDIASVACVDHAEIRLVSRSDARKRRSTFLEINCVSHRYVFGHYLHHGILTSLPERTIESHNRDALRSNVYRHSSKAECERKRERRREK